MAACEKKFPTQIFLLVRFFLGVGGDENLKIYLVLPVYSTEFCDSIKDSEGTNQTGDVQTDLSFLWLCMP